MAGCAKPDVYTVKTLKEILLKTKSWESSEDDFVGICDCIEGTLKDQKSLDHIKTYFKKLDKVWKPTSTCTDYKNAKTLLCNPSYLLKHQELQLLALQEVGYNSDRGTCSELPCDTARPEGHPSEVLQSHQSVSEVASIIEKLTNELEMEKERTAAIEDEKRLLIEKYTARETEATSHAKELQEKVLSVSKIVDTFNTPWNEVSSLPKKKKTKKKGKAKTLVPQPEEYQTSNGMTSSEVIKSTRQTLCNIFPKLQEMVEYFNSLHDLESWVSAADEAVKSGNEVISQSVSTSTKQDFPLGIPDKIREHMEGIFKDYSAQRKNASDLRDCVQRLKDENEEFVAKFQNIEQKHQKHEQGMEVLSQLKQQMEVDRTTIKEKEELQKSYTKDIQQLKHEIAVREEAIQQLRQENETLSKSHEQRIEDLSQVKQQLEDVTAVVQEKDELLENCKKDICQMELTLTHRENSLHEMKQENEERLERYEADVKELRGTILACNEEIEQLKDRKEELLTSHEQRIEDLSQLNQNLEDVTAVVQKKDELLENYTQTICQMELTIAQRDNSLQEMKLENDERLERYEADVKELRGTILAHNEEIEQLKDRKEELLTRISKQAEIKLTDGNHEITDLSDPNRPIILAQKFGELYDNEWTEAFEEVLENQRTATEQSAIQFLLEILTLTYDYCRRHADTQWKDILDVVCQQSTDQPSQIPSIYVKDLRNVRKLTGNTSAEGVTKRFFDSEITRLKLQPEKIGANLEIYIRKCVELCWLMSIQSPPIFLYKEINQHDCFDKDYFKFYTCPGKLVDFLVWPALLCRENGNLLHKGVCQGLKKK